MKHRIKLALGIAISAVCLWFAMHDVEPAEVFRALRQANYLGFVALMVLTLLGFWLRAFRWRWMLNTPKPVSTAALFSATMIGFMANNLLPLRLGEFVRAWALGRSERLPKSTVFATVVVERAVDMVTLIGLFGLVMVLHPIGQGTAASRLVRRGASTLLVVSLALTLVVVALERQPERMRRLLAWLLAGLPSRPRERGLAMLDEFLSGLLLFRDLPRLLWVLLLSLVMFGVYALCLTASMWAFAISSPWYAGLVMLVITAIGIMVPAAPGYIGTMNVACKVGLALFGVEADRSIPFSWFFWAGQWIPITLVGLVCLRRAGLSLASLGKIEEAA